MKWGKVVIFGAGLIGSSIGRDLLRLRLSNDVVIFDSNSKNARDAVRLKAATRVGKSDAECVDATLVIYALPVLALPEVMARTSRLIPKTALVIDVGSTKTNIVHIGDRHFKAGNFVGCHPMAGNENSGAKAGRCGLFEGRVCFYVAGKMTSKRCVSRARALWRSLQAIPVGIGAADHDALAAQISHLPHAVAFALMNAAAKAGIMRVKKFAGGGLRDTTRIAASSTTMWTDIFMDNAREILAAIASFESELNLLKKAIRSRDVSRLAAFMAQAAAIRRQIA